MGTRSGDMDPAIVEFLCNKEGKSVHDILNVLNKESGVLGLSEGYSSDFRDLEKGYHAGEEPSIRAMKSFAYRVVKYIGAYAAAMNGVDVICFTAGIGENNPFIRKMICSYLGYLGISMNEEENAKRGEEAVISNPESAVKVFVIPTNEELAIARETLELVK